MTRRDEPREIGEASPLHRRGFLKGGGLALVAGALPGACAAGAGGGATRPVRDRVVASTWNFGAAANAAAWEALEAGVSHPVEACERGAWVTEADPGIGSVGLGGRPNADGIVQLDAAVMRGDTLDCGSVAALEDTLHPVSVARAVMEHTRHVLLVGQGALAFARERGFPFHEMLTDKAREAWERWRAKQAEAAAAGTEPEGDGFAPRDDHDTLGILVLDRGRFGMAVTTSGAAWKLPGRVGDSPIVGAGGYCDDEAGACVATGLGEEMIRTCASFSVVDAMRRGAGPTEACEEVLARLAARGRSHNVALVACDRLGRVGGAANHEGFEYARTDAAGTEVVDVAKWSPS